MRKLQRIRVCKAALLLLCVWVLVMLSVPLAQSPSLPAAAITQDGVIQWVDFTVTSQAMTKALALDVASRDQAVKLDWIQLLACLSAQNGGKYTRYRDSQLDDLAQRIQNGEQAREICFNPKLFDYYVQAYTAALSGFVGSHTIMAPDEQGTGARWVQRYGLKAFSPIAKGYSYHHYDDFGNSRSYSYRRVHLGNDLMGRVGTPIIAVEGGVVEALGWNQYGGWRIGIRSHDRMRYYYYAHLRKDFPYEKSLYIGKTVTTGDVIGYLGRTGYSLKENVNNIATPHLHFGMQLVFDESQKDTPDEIWIDVYQIVRFLSKNRAEVIKNPQTGDYQRKYGLLE